MEKRPPLNTLRNRCISCAYLCAVLAQFVQPRISEVSDTERYQLIDKELAAQQKEYRYFKDWVIKDIINGVCPANEWKAHKDGVHPVTDEKSEKENKERANMVRWAIGVILTAAVLGLTIYSIFFQN